MVCRERKQLVSMIFRLTTDHLTTINIFAPAILNFFFTLSNCSSSKSVTGSVMIFRLRNTIKLPDRD